MFDFSCPNCITLLCSFRKILWITTKSSESAKSCWPWIEASSEKIPVFIIEATQETREVFSGWCPCINALQGWGILRRMWVWFLVKCGHGALSGFSAPALQTGRTLDFTALVNVWLLVNKKLRSHNMQGSYPLSVHYSLLAWANLFSQHYLCSFTWRIWINWAFSPTLVKKKKKKVCSGALKNNV